MRVVLEACLGVMVRIGNEKRCVCVCVCVCVCLLRKLGSKKWERIEDRKNR